MTGDSDPAFLTKSAPPVGGYAGAWIRFVALLIDGVIVWAVLVGVFFVVKPLGPDSVHLFLFRDQNPVGTRALLYVVQNAVTVAWLAGCQATAGTTPGMMLLSLRVLGPAGDRGPTLLAAVIRNSIPALAGVPEALRSIGLIGGNAGIRAALDVATVLAFGAIGVTISRSPTRQGIHDRLAGGTYVVRRARTTTTVR